MATIVCQGLQSCLESPLVESRTLRLKLSSPKTHFPQPLELALKPCFLDFSTEEFGQKEKPYVPPQINRTLSEKSLELCTENLGSETGTDITDDRIFSMSSSDLEKAGYYSPTREQQKPRQLWSSRKGNSRSFPPPLTTISGSESLQIRPHREDGRLIIEAIPSTHTYFEAERSNGRLRLTLFKNASSSSSSFDYFNDADNEEEFDNDNDNELVAEASSVVEEEEEEDEEMDGNKTNVGNEIGSEKINQRPSRCKEGEQEEKKKNGLLNWKPYWVTTS